MNAKSFNERSSEVFADAERIRKMLSNFMSKHNIAYKDPNYAAFPTPLPGQAEDVDEDSDTDGDSDPELADGKVQKLNTFVGSTPGPGKPADGRTASSTPVVEDAEGAGESFVGDTFQVAQEKILTELIHLKDDEYVLQRTYSSDANECFSQWSRDLVAIPQSSISTISRLLQTYQASSVPKERTKEGSGCQRARQADQYLFLPKLAGL